MKYFLPLFILTSLLFGQDTTLVIKNGKIIYDFSSKNKLKGWNIVDDKGYYGLKISKIKENVLTSFQSTRKARSFINYLSEKYNLCKKLNSTHNENHCCHAISLSQNTKRCYYEDSMKSYNGKFQKMKESLILPNKKFLMVDKNHKKPYPILNKIFQCQCQKT